MHGLDLFCGAGGATKGYQQRGHTITGVDAYPQPEYCGDNFVLMDAIEYLKTMTWTPDFIHWSPPCEEASTLTIGTNQSQGWGKEHVQYIPLIRPLLPAGIPLILEQPVGNAPMRRDLVLCMDMFPVGEPPWVQRHRYFELTGLTVRQPVHGRGGKWRGHKGNTRGWNHGGYQDGPYVAVYGKGGGKATLTEAQHALDMPWVNNLTSLTKAIPPAYTRYISKHLP